MSYKAKQEINNIKQGILPSIKNDGLPKTEYDIPIPNTKHYSSNGDRICDTCIKEDVCMYKAELAQAAKEISQISERTNVFIDTDIKCKKWSSKVSKHR